MRDGVPREAMFQEPLAGGAVRCRLCAHLCVVRPGKRGICKVRENRDGTLFSLSYGMLTSLASDPIEKKPLFHFLPGTSSLSVATAGCNLSCPWCQNHSLSRMPGRTPRIPGRMTLPDEIVEHATRSGCRTISYTYSEPTIFYEYAREIGIVARRNAIRNVFVTNGHMTPDVVRDAASTFLDAANVDLKGGSRAFYKHHCKAKMEAVLDTITLMHSLNVWVEVTTLLIPDTNDSADDLRQVAGFIASVDRAIPWHVSRFHPDLHFTHLPPTPLESLRRAVDIGREAGLLHIYMGNAWGAGGEDTLCPSCGQVVQRRLGFTTQNVGLEGGTCRSCGRPIAGVFS
jgi:pyruvate formate lyase activating enzyme